MISSSLSVQLLTGTSVASMSRPLWLEPLWTLACTCLCELMFSFFPGCVPGSGVGRSYGSLMDSVIFNYIRFYLSEHRTSSLLQIPFCCPLQVEIWPSLCTKPITDVLPFVQKIPASSVKTHHGCASICSKDTSQLCWNCNQSWGPVDHCSKANREARLAERMICFIWTSVRRPTPPALLTIKGKNFYIL